VRRLRCFCLALTLAATLWSQEISRVTLVVDNAHYSASAIASWSGSGAIAKALAAIPSGATATIQVPAGYVETPTSEIVVPSTVSNLTIQGAQGAVLKAGADGMNVMRILGNFVTVRGMSFDANGHTGTTGIMAGTSVSQYQTGTASITSGGTAITGVGTTWTSSMVVAGGKTVFGIESGGVFGTCVVSAFIDATHLTCAAPGFTGSTASGLSYFVIWVPSPAVDGFLSDGNVFTGHDYDHVIYNATAEVKNSTGLPRLECVLYNTFLNTFANGASINYHDSTCSPTVGKVAAMEAQGNGIAFYFMRNVTLIANGLAFTPGIFSGGSSGYGGPYDQLVGGEISGNHCENVLPMNANAGGGAFAIEVYGHDFTVEGNDCNGTAVGILYSGQRNKYVHNRFSDIFVGPAATTTGSVTSGMTTLTVSSGLGITSGMVVVDTGSANGIPLNTRVTGAGTTWTLSAAATASLSGEPLAFMSDELTAYGWGAQMNHGQGYTSPLNIAGNNTFEDNRCTNCMSGNINTAGSLGGNTIIGNSDARSFGFLATDTQQIYRGIESGGTQQPDMHVGNQSYLSASAAGYSLSSPSQFFWGCWSDQSSTALGPISIQGGICSNQNTTPFGQPLVGFAGGSYFNGSTVTDTTWFNMAQGGAGVSGLASSTIAYCGNRSLPGSGSAIAGDFLLGCNQAPPGPGGPTLDVITFTPTAIGWYRVASGANLISGHLEIFDPSYDGTAENAAFWYAGNTSAASYLNQDQYLFYNFGSVVDQARLSYDGSGIVYLDVHVSTATSPTPLTLYFSEWGTLNGATQTLVSSPVVGATAVNLTATLTMGPGFQSTVAIANSQLAHSSVTVTAGSGLTGGGAVSLGGSVTVSGGGVTHTTTQPCTGTQVFTNGVLTSVSGTC
jgi:hypothetical protein